ncbi:hypothetical protein JCM10207_004540 [Rhodosporidiobolus poonsookiae]
MPRYSTASDTEDYGPSLVASPVPSTSTAAFPSTRLADPVFTSLTLQQQPDDDEDDDEEAWDEVDIPQAVQGSADDAGAAGARAAAAAASEGQGIEVVISHGGGAAGKGKQKKPGLTLKERMVRQERHKVHVLSLFGMAMVRNKWLNDPELQARLLSQVPLAILTSFTSITRTAFPNPRDRSRLFDRALQDLVSWFYRAWEVDPDKNLRRREVGEVEDELEAWRKEWERLVAKEEKRRAKLEGKGEGKGKGKETDQKGEGDAASFRLEAEQAFNRWPWEEPEQLSEAKRKKALEAQAERLSSTSSSSNPRSSSSTPLVRPYTSPLSPSGGPPSWEALRPPAPSAASRTPPALYLAATQLRGSHDLQAQMLVALLRAMDIPARLVVSLQGVEWRSKTAAGGKAKAPAPAKGKGKKGAAGAAKGKAGAKGKGKARARPPSSDSSSFSDDSSSSEDERGRRRARTHGKAPLKAFAGTGRPKPSASASASASMSRKSSAASSSSAKPSSAVKASSVKPKVKASSVKPSTATTSTSTSKKPLRKPPPDEITLSTTTASSASDTDGSFEDGQGKLNYKVPKPTLRKSAVTSAGKTRVAGWKRELELRRSASPDELALSRPPTQWIEAYTRYNKEWITVDVSRKRMRCRGIMDPAAPAGGVGGAAKKAQGTRGRGVEGNMLAYVVGIEEDGSAHDLTPRYAASYATVAQKLRCPTSSKMRKELNGGDWWSGVVGKWGRKFKLTRDKEEAEEMAKLMKNEPFPTSLGGFKNHPNYVLEQHLHRDEALLPSARSLGLFKGEHAVFRRSDVVAVKSTENWYRTGRKVKTGEIPRKWVKQRAVTIHNRRKEELAKMDGGEVEEQPLFEENQTEVYIPPPVVDGKVPKNNFGNIDLFVPSMLPAGASHMPSKVAAKCAKELGIDYAEAITGFEFRQRRANPIILGVVIAEEHAETLREAIVALEQTTLEKELAKQQERVLKRWKKLIQGLRIRQRLMDQFKDPDDAEAVKEEASKLSARDGGASTSAGGAKKATAAKKAAPASKKRAKRPPSDDEDTSAAEEAEYAAKPPPRKRLASSTNTSSTPSTFATRTTRSSARPAASTPAAAAADEPGEGRSLRIKLKLPALSSPAPPASEPASARRSTRASAVKARGNFKLDEASGSDADEKGEGEDEDEEVELEPVANGSGGVINGAGPSPVDEEGGFVREEDGAEEAGGGGGGLIPEPADEAPAAGGFIPEEGGGFLTDEAGGFLPEPAAAEGAGGGEDQEDYGFEYESE